MPKSRYFLIGLVLFSLFSLIGFGILGIGRSGLANFDGVVFYAAGKTWLSGANPYSHRELVTSSIAYAGSNLDGIFFFYPPQSSLLAIPQAFFNYPTAAKLWMLTNLLSLIPIVTMTVIMVRRLVPGEMGRIGGWVLTAIAIGNPFTTHVIWMGQTSLIACAATMGAWFFSRQDRRVLAGICLGLATFKPQIVFLLLLWFLLQREWKILWVALASIGLFSLYPMFMNGPIGMLIAWWGGIQESYKALIFNTPGFQHKVGVESMLESAGVMVPGLLPVAIALTILLWSQRKKINQEDILALLTAITFSFVGYTHDYDYVCLIPIFITLWVYCCNRSKLWFTVIPLLFLLFLPQRAVRILDIPVLNHWRTLVVLTFLVILIVLNFRKGNQYQAVLLE